MIENLCYLLLGLHFLRQTHADFVYTSGLDCDSAMSFGLQVDASQEDGLIEFCQTVRFQKGH
jgi:hypothetical protein